MGYRKYAKDYEIEYVPRPGKKREKAVRIYVGPYFRFKASAEQINRLKRQYLLGLVWLAALLLIPMCIDCPFTRTWYIQGPAAAAVIPWVFAACATWRLWTAKDKVDREHYDMMHDRMNGACLFLMGLCIGSTAGCVLSLSKGGATAADLVVCFCCLAAAVCAVFLFSKRKGLEMIQEDNPEKPHKQK